MHRRLLYVTKLAPMLVWHLPDQKISGKAFMVLPFTLVNVTVDFRFTSGQALLLYFTDLQCSVHTGYVFYDTLACFTLSKDG